MTSDPETCPACAASLVGDPIPEQVRSRHGGKTHFSRIVGAEVAEAYDGVLFWACPDCAHAWPREHGNVRLDELSAYYATSHNQGLTGVKTVAQYAAERARRADAHGIGAVRVSDTAAQEVTVAQRGDRTTPGRGS